MIRDPLRTAVVGEVRVSIGAQELVGDLTQPRGAAGLVLFAHGSGSSRHSPRNRAVATSLVRRGFATLLIDLLTPAEDEADRSTGHLRFDVPMLANRLAAIIDWLRQRPEAADVPIGLFGASTGGGAAIVAATMRPSDVAAVVSRGGRPDLAGDALDRIAVPTLLIVGDRDTTVLELNETAMARMHHHATLEIVPNATHLFEEPGALERVADAAGDWFSRYLVVHGVAAGRP
jgi:dienelactone hydrolase